MSNNSQSAPFYFFTRLTLTKLLGLQAKNPRELLECIKIVPSSSIYYHTHKFLLQHHYLSPEPPNDFAYWITNILNLQELGERLSSVDVIRFNSIEELRSEFIKILSDFISTNKNGGVECPENCEFHFMSCINIILPTPYIAHNLKEFVEALSKVSINSLYFHVFDARLRLGRNENDFSNWFNMLGLSKLSREISRLDPYTMTLEGLKQRIIKLVKMYA